MIAVNTLSNTSRPRSLSLSIRGTKPLNDFEENTDTLFAFLLERLRRYHSTLREHKKNADYGPL